MNYYSSPIKPSASGTRWLPADDLHEFLYADWIYDADKIGLRFDFHLPGCEADPSCVIESLIDFTRRRVTDLDPDLPYFLLAEPNEKWLMLSGLQKAIRRSDFDAAWRCASALFNSGQASQMWRRFAIIMLEDIGVADPYACALVSLAASTKSVRAELGDKRLLAWLLKIACDAPKSRDLCDTIEMLAIDVGKPGFLDLIKATSLEARIATAANPDAPFGDRLAAYGTAFGPRWGGAGKPDVAARDAMQAAMGLPVLFRVITSLNHRVTGEALNIPLPFVYEYLLQSGTAKTGPDYFSGSVGEKLNGMHSAAYDRHTWAGKAAIRKFIHACPELGKRLYEYGTPPDQHVALIERAIFYVEGGILSPRLYYMGARDLYYDVIEAKVIAANQLPSLDLAIEFFELVRANIGKLRKFRLIAQ